MPILQIVRDKVEVLDHALQYLKVKKQEYIFVELVLNKVLVRLKEIMIYLQVMFHEYALRDIKKYNEHIGKSSIFFFQHFLEKL